MQDIVKAKGYLTLGSRLRRLGERMQADVQLMAKTAGMDLPAGLFPTLAAIDTKGALTVGELALALGISQPGATRNIKQLAAIGLVVLKASDKDGRSKRITLSRKSKSLVAKAKRTLWPNVEQAVADICEPLKGGLLDMLEAIETALDQIPLHQRRIRPKRQ